MTDDGASLAVQRSVELNVPASEDSCDEVGNNVTVVTTLSATRETRDQRSAAVSYSTHPDETSVHCTEVCPVNEAANPTNGSRKTYLVRFEGNNSKKWDGHDVELDGEWLESLYDVSELQIPGKQLNLPWPGKGRQIRQWNAVVSTPRGTESDRGSEKPSCEQHTAQKRQLTKASVKTKAKAKTKAPPKKRSRGCKSLFLYLSLSVSLSLSLTHTHTHMHTIKTY